MKKNFFFPYAFFHFFMYIFSFVAWGSVNNANLRIFNCLFWMGIRILRNRNNRSRVESSLVSLNIWLSRPTSENFDRRTSIHRRIDRYYHYNKGVIKNWKMWSVIQYGSKVQKIFFFFFARNRISRIRVKKKKTKIDKIIFEW